MLAAPVGLELSLVIDVSGSISTAEYELQRDGYAGAFLDPLIQAAIVSTTGGVAVNVIHFGTNATEVVPWTLLTTAADATLFSATLSGVARAESGRTNIIKGIELATSSFVGNGYEGKRLVIDVSGDGRQNEDGCTGAETICLPLQAARDAAAGIAIFGLPILTEFPDLDDYFTDNVIRGGGTVFVASDLSAFDEAIAEKIFTEIIVPEPGTLALIGSALAVIGLISRRRSA
jgi:hypothetical protein